MKGQENPVCLDSQIIFECLLHSVYELFCCVGRYFILK
uniref:Uncharacterized protein n=1 Tax=Arundo donax TaxID=35708 RepID=A0A0A9AIQ5_ARUDO